MLNLIRVCLWIGDGCGCRQPTIYGKAYCEEHYVRVYKEYSAKEANNILEDDARDDPD